MGVEGAPDNAKMRRAAQYLRMSTEHQQYSIANQAAAISLYAAAHQIFIVSSYVDPGKSGVTIRSRYALQDLIRTVKSGQAHFDCVLVYDISRWGRFQDLDEPAHYEYVCRSAGIDVHYCAEQFENDHSMLSGLLKLMKRMMAGEYSRELSVKVSAGQQRLAKMGFAQGSVALYGLRRLLVDAEGNPKQILLPRELKSLHTDRVVYVPGPSAETSVIKEIFECCNRGDNPTDIAVALNNAGFAPRPGGFWTANAVRRLLRNEKYTGSYVYAKTSKKMGRALIQNSPDKWIVNRDAFTPVISRSDFASAQVQLALFSRTYSDEQLLDRLRQLLKENGRLTSTLIKRQKSGPRAATYARRFGNLQNAFARVGFRHVRDYDRESDLRRHLRAIRLAWQRRTIEQFEERGVEVSRARGQGVLTVNQELKVGFRLLPFKQFVWPKLTNGWQHDIRFRKGIQILILASLNKSNRYIQAQYIVPKLSGLQGRYCSAQRNRVFLESCRSDTLQPIFDALVRAPLQLWRSPWKQESLESSAAGQ